jgi:hypothetical protein
MPGLYEVYPGICLTTEENARKNLSHLKERALVIINCKCNKPEHIQTGNCEIAVLYTKQMGVMHVSFCVFEGTTCLLFQNLVHNVGNSVNRH